MGREGKGRSMVRCRSRIVALDAGAGVLLLHSTSAPGSREKL